MPGFAFSIRTKLAIWAALGVLLVAGMLAEQQMGDRSAAQLRVLAANEQHTAVEALRGAKDLGNMALELREMRLAIAPAEVDNALGQLRTDAAAATRHIDIAIQLTDAPADRAQLQKLDALIADYAGISAEIAATARDYGDTVDLVKGAGEIDGEMSALVDSSTETLITTAEKRNARARAHRELVGRIDLGIGLFVIAVLAGARCSACSPSSVRSAASATSCLRLAHGDKDVEVPYTGRADEVGDNARAAQSFKEKLIRIEQLEIAEKQTAQPHGRAAPRRHARSRAPVRGHGGKRGALGVDLVHRARSGGGDARHDGGRDAGSVRQGCCRRRHEPRTTCSRFRSPPTS